MEKKLSVFEAFGGPKVIIIASVMALLGFGILAAWKSSKEAAIDEAILRERRATEVKIGANNLVIELKTPACSDGWSLILATRNGWKVSWDIGARFQYKTRAIDTQWLDPPADGNFIGERVRFCFRDESQAGSWVKLSWRRLNPNRPEWVTVRLCNHDLGTGWSDRIDGRKADARRVEWPPEWDIWVHRFTRGEWVDHRTDFLEGWDGPFYVCTDNRDLIGKSMPLTWID